MSFITVGLDENKTYNRAVPPGGHTSDWTVGNYENKQQKRCQRELSPHSNVSFSLNNNVSPGVPMVRSKDQLDNFSTVRLRREEEGDMSRQKLSSSRFSAALEQPLLDLNTTEKMRTPRGLLRMGVPGENSQSQSRSNKPPPGGGSSDFWGNM